MKKTYNNFNKHVHIERLLKERIANDNFTFNKKIQTEITRVATPTLIEATGDIEIFSIKKILDLWRDAGIIFGDDRKKYARNLLEELGKSKNRKNFVSAPELNQIKILEEQFPNFIEAINYIRSAIALSNLTENKSFEISPLLLVGEPGLGKTAFCQHFASILKTSFARIDVGCMSSSSVLSGLSFGWGNGHVGEIFNTFLKSNNASPIFLLDELDKLSGHDSMPVLPTLLSLLEPESSKSFRDEAIMIELNCSKAIWIASANEISMIPKPLLSRFTIVNIQKPDKQQSDTIIKNIYRKIRESNKWGRFFESMPSEELLRALNAFSPREISIYLKVGFGNAARRKSKTVTHIDLCLPHKNTNSVNFKMGFL